MLQVRQSASHQSLLTFFEEADHFGSHLVLAANCTVFANSTSHSPAISGSVCRERCLDEPGIESDRHPAQNLTIEGANTVKNITLAIANNIIS